MKRFRARDPHARYLELLSTQLDEPLRLDESWELTVHLARCQRCRAAERDYREQRRRLHALPQLTPPRDLGARVSAALDREVLRSPSLPSGRRLAPAGRRPSRSYVYGTSAVVSLTALSVGALVVLTGMPPAQPEATTLRPTPMAVPGQALAYLGAGPDGLALYRTSVDEVCPAAALDCVAAVDEQALMAFSRNMRPNSLALSPNGDRLVLRAEDADSQEDVFAVVVMPQTPRTATPSDPAPAAPRGSAAAHATGVPTSSTTTFHATEPPTRSDAPASTPQPPAAPPEPSPDTPSDPAATLDPSFGLPTPISTAAASTMVAILEDVRGVGAAPAWSTDGTMLAFSAMPADGSRGPDVYVWQPTDDSARPITSDHASYFASWSGGHIVASRVLPSDDADRAGSVVNVLLDPSTSAEIAIEGPPVWLPQVNRDRSLAVGWQGDFDVDGDGRAVRPRAGALFVFDWSLVDPLAQGPDATAEPSPSSDPRDEPTDVPTPEAPPETPAPSDAVTPPTLVTLPPRGASEAPDQPSQTPEASAPPTPTPPASIEPSATPEPAPTAHVRLAPLETSTSGAANVVDWEVRWAPDGTALGYWIADAAGASWGRLTVVPVDANGKIDASAPFLAPTLARRSFALGLNRVAWVAPTEASPEGELRISFWGPDGSGVLRLGDPDVYGVLAAF